MFKEILYLDRTYQLIFSLLRSSILFLCVPWLKRIFLLNGRVSLKKKMLRTFKQSLICISIYLLYNVRYLSMNYIISRRSTHTSYHRFFAEISDFICNISACVCDFKFVYFTSFVGIFSKKIKKKLFRGNVWLFSSS